MHTQLFFKHNYTHNALARSHIHTFSVVVFFEGRGRAVPPTDTIVFCHETLNMFLPLDQYPTSLSCYTFRLY